MSIARKILEVESLSQTLCNLSAISLNAEIKVLYFIDLYAGATPHFLSSKLGIKKPNLANMTRKLLSLNYIDIKTNPIDKRSIHYTITHSGKKVLNDYLQELDKLFHEDNLPETETYLDNVLKYLNKKI